MLAVRTEKLLGRPLTCWSARRLEAPVVAALFCSAPSQSSLLVLLVSPLTSRFMERERTLLRAELDLARLRESVEWQCRDRQPDDRWRLKVAPDEVRRGFCFCELVSATTVLLEEPVAVSSWCLLFLTLLLLLLLLLLLPKLSSEVEEEVAVDELGDNIAWLGLTPLRTARTRCL
jgi:hypothetical protein